MSQKQYDETNRGALFVNDRKESDKHPDMRGKININGVEYWLSGWWKETQRGDVLSLALGNQVEGQGQAPRQPQAQPARRGRPQAQQAQESFGAGDMGDDIPFAPISSRLPV